MIRFGLDVTVPKMRLVPATLRAAEDAAGDHLANMLRPRLPIDTGQLQKSLFWSKRERAVMFRRTIRWRRSGGGRVWTDLTNNRLAVILDGRGYDLLDPNRGHKAQATAKAREVLRSRRAFVSAGKAVLRMPLL